MKVIVFFSILTLAGLYLSSMKSGPEKALSDVIDCMDEMTEVLKTIKNEDTAAKAMPKLVKMGRKMQDATVDMANSFSKADPQEMQKLFKEYEKPMEEAGQRFARELMRVSSIPKVGKDFQQFFAFMNSGSTGNTRSTGSTRRG